MKKGRLSDAFWKSLKNGTLNMAGGTLVLGGGIAEAAMGHPSVLGATVPGAVLCFGIGIPRFINRKNSAPIPQ